MTRTVMAAAGALALLLPPAALSAPPAAGPPGARPTTAPAKTDATPGQIAGYAALTDPVTGRHYVQRNGYAVHHGLNLQGVFTRLIDGSPTYVDVCFYMCGTDVDDRGVVQPLNSATTTAFAYILILRADRSAAGDPSVSAGTTSAGLSAYTVRYDPSRYQYVELRATMDITDAAGTRTGTVRLVPRNAPFDRMPTP